jgi:hypothetical protein
VRAEQLLELFGVQQETVEVVVEARGAHRGRSFGDAASGSQGPPAMSLADYGGLTRMKTDADSPKGADRDLR